MANDQYVIRIKETRNFNNLFHVKIGMLSSYYFFLSTLKNSIYP